MNIRPLLRGVLPVAIFVIAAVLTYAAIGRWRPAGQGENRKDSTGKVQAAGAASSGEKQKGAIEGVEGLSEGEVIALPQLTKLDGHTIALDGSRENHLLFAFFATRCPSCTQVAEIGRAHV